MQFKNIFRMKIRSILTMSGIAVGAFAVAIIAQISATGAEQISGIMDSMGINTVLVQAKQANNSAMLEAVDIASLAAVTGVEKAMPLMSANARLELLHKDMPCLLWGVDREAREIISLEPIHGRLIDERDIRESAFVCVIDEDIARKTYGRSNITGKKIKLLISGKWQEFEIVGVANSGLSVLQSALAGIIPDFVYVPFSTMQILTGRDYYDKIAVLLGENSAENVTELIERKLLASGKDDLVASNLLQQKNQLQTMMFTIVFVLSAIAAISLFVAGITIMTTMLVSVSERTREIGIKKSVGAKNFIIMREFLLEGALLSFIGSAAGSIAALIVSIAACKLLGIAFVFNAWRFLSPVLFSLFLGMVFGAYPAVKAASMKPIEALRM